MRKKAVFGLLLMTLAGCGGNTGSNAVIQNISLINNPNAAAPLAAIFALEADQRVTVRLVLEDGSEPWVEALSHDPAFRHEAVILGLHANSEYLVTAVVTNATGQETTSQPQLLKTAKYPDDFPALELKTSVVSKMEPGVTLFNLIHWQEDGSGDRDFGGLIAVNEAGVVIWFYRPDHAPTDARLLANGNILYIAGRNGVGYEIDMLGNVVHQWHATGTKKEVDATSIPVKTDTFHHDLVEMPSGNLLTISSEIRGYDNYVTSPSDPTPKTEQTHLVGDVLVEFTREGEIVREVSLLDILDPYRIGSAPSFSGEFWQEVYKGVFDGALLDWGHTNSVIFDEEQNAFIASVRRQDAVIKLDAKSGELIWILGNHARWNAPWQSKLLKPVGDVVWPNHGHAVELTPDRTYLMYDNGSSREGADHKSKRYSRVVEYAVDEAAGEVREVWQYGNRPGEEFYSSFVSDADWLPRTGNILITDGGRIRDEKGEYAPQFAGHHWARILEVTHTNPAEVVFELVIDDASGAWNVYRAERIRSLYSND